MTAFLQCLKETYADPSEILCLEWKEIKDNVITIAHPYKGHLMGQYEVSARLMSMLNAMPKTDKRVFPTTYRAMNNCLKSLKRKDARKMHDPAVLDVTFKSIRHWRFNNSAPHQRKRLDSQEYATAQVYSKHDEVHAHS